jgi:hypothetical protein
MKRNDTPKKTPPPQGEVLRDTQVTLFKSAAGLIPVIGSILQGIIEVTIPNQRIERIEAFLRHLSDRIQEVELRNAVATPEGLDLFEEGIWQAARALSDERKQQIAELVVKGFKSDSMEKATARHFLRILNQIDDRQIILLAKYLPENQPYVGNTNAENFSKNHFDVIDPGHSVVDIFDVENRKKADFGHRLNASMLWHLSAFGLLEENESIDSIGEPLVSRQFSITELGKEFLKFLGVTGE